jgi:cyanuric acid amidohydrolase
MAPISILKFGVSSPADTLPLKELKAAGYGANDILGVVGKSEGKYPSLVAGIGFQDIDDRNGFAN